MKHTLLAVLAFLSLSAPAQIITTIAGNDSVGYCCDGELAIHAGLYHPNDVAIDAAGNIYIADESNHRIRKVDITGIITTIAGTGVAGYNGDNIAATSAQLNLPTTIALDINGDLYVCDDGNFRIRKINSAGIITTIAGTGVRGYNGDNIPAISAEISSSSGIAIDVNSIFISTIDSCRIRKIDRSTGIITTFAGNGQIGYNGDGGQATNANLYNPTYIVEDQYGNIYIAEHGNHTVRKVNTIGVISTIAGDGTSGNSGDNGPATAAKFNWPNGIAIDNAGNIYISDANDNSIRMINNAGVVNTIAGTGINGFAGDGGAATAAKLHDPSGIKVDNTGSIYFADWYNNRIRYIKNALSANSLTNAIPNIKIYPNPAVGGNFNVDISSTIDRQLNIVITDLFGNRVAEIPGNTNRNIAVQLNVSTGMYILYANDGQNVSTAKINVIR